MSDGGECVFAGQGTAAGRYPWVGDVKGQEGSVAVHSFTHGVDVPHDPQSGLPTGKRMHKPITIVKDIDESSPYLWEALIGNENLTYWQMQLWQTALGGAEEKEYYFITLTNASIASIREYMGDAQVAGNAGLLPREEITFTYQKINWVWANGNVAAGDDWAVRG